MSILFKYITSIEEPYWEVLTCKHRWWKIKDYNVRIVFKFFIKDDIYRIDYDVENNDVIYVHKKPKKLLLKNGINPDNEADWLTEQRKLLRILLELYDDKIKQLMNNKPEKPKWFRLIF